MKLSKNQLKELVNEAYGEVIIEQIGLEQAREIALIGEIALTLGLDIQSRSKIRRASLYKWLKRYYK